MKFLALSLAALLPLVGTCSEYVDFNVGWEWRRGGDNAPQCFSLRIFAPEPDGKRHSAVCIKEDRG